ncbi:hypothetical protein Leryth_008361 [Lithospermum erythrorhizon]|nr:hypothetical protein Leryth_008361 [Lithospermum erythrorhizon]
MSRYWCSFGPDDHKKRVQNKSAGRPNTKRGCTCHFIVKRLIAEPTIALIIYNQDQHIDKVLAGVTRLLGPVPCMLHTSRKNFASCNYQRVNVETMGNNIIREKQ